VSLKLENNKLQALPVGIGQIVKLEVLDIANNAVTDLPLSLATLGNIKSLRCVANVFTLSYGVYSVGTDWREIRSEPHLLKLWPVD
jgi:hypothetical protein